MSRWSYFRKRTCWNIYQFLYFWTVSSNFSDFWHKKRTGLPKLPSTVSEIFIKKTFFSPEKIHLSVSDFELMIFVLLVKKFGRFSKTALYVSRGDFRRKKFFELKSLFSISLWIWADDFQDSDEKCPKCQRSCILPVQSNILPKNGSEKKNSTLSDFQGKILRISTEKCREEISGGTTFALKR